MAGPVHHVRSLRLKQDTLKLNVKAWLLVFGIQGYHALVNPEIVQRRYTLSFKGMIYQ